MSMRSARGSAPARAALAGNPSDGYGGRVLAVALEDLGAEATVEPAEADDVPGDLARAALSRFRARFGERAPVRVRWTTTVPREVGLAGSSAIVIAVLRALLAAHDLALTPDELAREALAAETEELGIAAGLQDRLVQVHGALLAMDFGPSGGGAEVLDRALLPPLYVAWHAEAASPSGAIHAELRAREREVRPVMDELAALAARAREALLSGDHAAFAESVDGSLDARARVMPVHPRVERMARIARAAGGAANSAGSGGAIVGTVSAEAWPGLREAFAKEGCGVLRPRA
jgi:glucuronokinase